MKRSLLFALSCCVLVALPATAALQDEQARAKQQELEQLRSRIQAVQRELAQDLGQRDKLNRELRSAEEDLSRAANALREVNIRLDFTQEKLSSLEAEQRARRAALAAEKKALAAQVRAAYISGREEKMKLILNQEDPARFGRMLAYYDFFNRERATRIGRVNQQIERLKEIELEIAAELKALDKTRNDRANILARLEHTRDQRANVLAELEEAIRDRNEELKRLQQDEKALANLVQSLLDVFADIPTQLNNRPAFTSLRGKLPWPAQGKVVANYGDARSEGRLRWNGVMIAAEPGTPVRAVSYGRVAYADWLPHYGLLLIIEHGDGYLSLYGHNQTLYKEVGDWVETGEIVAAMGDSGGQQKAALYFEIRHKKDVQDPRRWFAAK